MWVLLVVVMVGLKFNRDVYEVKTHNRGHRTGRGRVRGLFVVHMFCHTQLVVWRVSRLGCMELPDRALANVYYCQQALSAAIGYPIGVQIVDIHSDIRTGIVYADLQITDTVNAMTAYDCIRYLNGRPMPTPGMYPFRLRLIRLSHYYQAPVPEMHDPRPRPVSYRRRLRKRRHSITVNANCYCCYPYYYPGTPLPPWYPYPPAPPLPPVLPPPPPPPSQPPQPPPPQPPLLTWYPPPSWITWNRTHPQITTWYPPKPSPQSSQPATAAISYPWAKAYSGPEPCTTRSKKSHF
ncbi:hypothetical protein B0T17DRAFT_638903 [Bombardia bombarda]|uniref:Uncharacterized protein n=1 Tax=Bombardia bombarda TaxID=252184 RepID=A0AA40C4A6_9PEZI|nr:hypothetical protein B0T17DRAFT_638903 [Bombardia bombarda]